MKFESLFKSVAVAGLAAGVVMGMATSAQAQKSIKWKMQSAFGSKLSILGPTAKRFTNNIAVMSGDKLKIKFFEPNALVPALEIHSSVANGAIDSGWTTPGYYVGRIPALAFFTTLPFGPGATEYLGWLKFGGGGPLYDRIYDGLGLKGLRCLAIAPEASGWFRQPMKGVEDFKGMKMRFFGLGALVMNKIGVSTQLLAGADIYPALERGVIDATEFSMPSIDYDLGFYQIAKHYYFPGWHQQTSAGEFIIHKPKWEGLSEQHKAIVDNACEAALAWSLIRSDIIQADAMKKLKAKGVTIHRWDDSFIDLLRVKWDEVMTEHMAKDPLFKEIADDYLAFRANYKIWKDMAYLK